VKAICILILVVWGYWLLNNLGWKGGWVATLLGLALLSYFRSWKLFIISLVLLALAVLMNVESLTQTLIAPEIASISTIRPIVWIDILRMVLPRSPLLGLGLVNYMYYWYDPTFVSQARIAAGEAFINNYVFVIPSHNMFVDIIAQTGILGLGLFLWLIATILKVLYRGTQQLRPGFERAFTIGVIAGFVAMLFNSFISADYLLPFVYNITITGFRQSVYAWILVGGAMAISTSQVNNSKPGKSGTSDINS
jgi:O-antigen ligase